MAAEIAVAGAEKIAGSIAEVFIIQPFKDCYNLEENHALLNENIQSMFLELCHACARFQAERRVLQDPVENCIKKMVDAVKKAKLLSVRIEERGSRCCWNLCYPKLSKKCREWNTKFGDLFKELYSHIHFVADVEQVVTSARARPVLPLPVPVAGFVGSGIRSAERHLQEWLTQSKPAHRVVGVWGMGGIGKTSLLKIIHNHFQKVSSIFEIVIWVTVSQNFKVEGFYNSIAKALDMKLDEKIDSNMARTEVCTVLETKKFLLILDDLWERIDFEEVGFSFGNHQGSRVLISSRNHQVIAEMGAKDSCWEMKLLSEEEAWDMFKSKAFTDGPAASDTNIEAIAREIAKKCQGLPLAVNAVGAAMISNNTEEDWSLASSLMGTPDQGFQLKIDKQLRYSYDVLSKRLKICFLYCAAFPEDEEIDAHRLVEIWIAEGLLRSGQRTDLMDVGHDCLNQLAKRCLINYYVVPFHRYDPFGQRTIKVHDVLREMAIRIGESESEEHCLFATNQHLTDFQDLEVSSCKRISLGHNDIQDLPTDLMKCPNLVSLLLPFNHKLSHVPQSFLSSVISLRVLDLSWTGITELPISVGELRLVEFLDLSHCRELIELPDSVGNLSALQFLNLNRCSNLKRLPSTIRGLKKLKHLNLDGCDEMQVNSDDIGQLISLNRLVIGNDTAVRAGDLKNLTKMRVLNASVTADGGDVVTIDTWTEMKHLTLSFQSNGVNIEKIERVEKLHLTGYGGVNLPNCQFQNLKVLQLEKCTELTELPLRSFPMLTLLHLDELSKLESLSGPANVWNEGSMSKLQDLTIMDCPLLKKLPLGMRLPNLAVLWIYCCDSIKELDIGNRDFPMLQRLLLYELKELESITVSSGVGNEEATSTLERVEIQGCPLLKKLPLGMRIPDLKVLWIYHCDGIKELDIGNGDCSMLEHLLLSGLKELESIRGSSGVWNEEATSKLERVVISFCPLLKTLSFGMRLPNLKELKIESCDSIKELDIGNRDFPMLEELELAELKELESITASSGVWNEEATSKLETVVIRKCPLLRRLPRAMEKLFSLNKLHWEDRDESVVLSELW